MIMSHLAPGPAKHCRLLRWRANISVVARGFAYQSKKGTDGNTQISKLKEHGEHSRHLLRAILRECSYLPSGHIRTWAAQYASSRFRTYSFKTWKNRDNPKFEDRILAKQKEARQWIALLRRAYEGDRSCLQRIFLMAYGRIGKRRHELLLPLTLQPNEAESYIPEQGTSKSEVKTSATPSVVKAMETSNELDAPSRPNTPAEAQATRQIEVPLSPQLRALLASQIQTAPPEVLGANPRRLTAEIRLYNTWLRPMPLVRVNNALEKHRRDLIDRVLPPLPTAEWQELHDLASGKRTIEALQPRRSQSRGDRAIKTSVALETVVAYGKPPEKVIDRKNGRSSIITVRHLRKLYEHVFNICPKMDWDANLQKWKVTWGSKSLRSVLNNMATLETDDSSTSVESLMGAKSDG